MSAFFLKPIGYACVCCVCVYVNGRCSAFLNCRKMESTFSIVLNLRTAKGFARFGQIELGTDKASVEAVYKTLEGREPEGDEGFLHIDLVETRNGLPVSLRVLVCTADELGRNVTLISRQVFRWKNLDLAIPDDHD